MLTLYDYIYITSKVTSPIFYYGSTYRVYSKHLYSCTVLNILPCLHPFQPHSHKWYSITSLLVSPFFILLTNILLVILLTLFPPKCLNLQNALLTFAITPFYIPYFIHPFGGWSVDMGGHSFFFEQLPTQTLPTV